MNFNFGIGDCNPNVSVYPSQADSVAVYKNVPCTKGIHIDGASAWARIFISDEQALKLRDDLLRFFPLEPRISINGDPACIHTGEVPCDGSTIISEAEACEALAEQTPIGHRPAKLEAEYDRIAMLPADEASRPVGAEDAYGIADALLAERQKGDDV